MKIEIGESLCYSYLRHVKECWLVQANWKASENWPKRSVAWHSEIIYGSFVELESETERIDIISVTRMPETEGNSFSMKETSAMQKAIYLKATVLPEGKIEIEDTGLQEGESVDVIVMRSEKTAPRRSALDIIREGPGQRLFKSAADVEEYLKSERASWDI